MYNQLNFDKKTEITPRRKGLGKSHLGIQSSHSKLNTDKFCDLPEVSPYVVFSIWPVQSLVCGFLICAVVLECEGIHEDTTGHCVSPGRMLVLDPWSVKRRSGSSLHIEVEDCWGSHPQIWIIKCKMGKDLT